MNRSPRPVLVINPVDDGPFVAAAERLLDDDVLALEEFRARLRESYPEAAVHPRELTAEPVLIWYVYRHGRWVNPTGQHGGSATSSEYGNPEGRSQSYRAVDPS